MSGVIPPELRMFTLSKTGGVRLEKIGEVVPWKLTLAELAKPELRARVCARVPEKMVVPELEKLPEFKKSPAKVHVELPGE